ncbi:peroxide stress protein YaaA [Sediminitomix flava]|uniref:UPF0246 protein BC781_1012 n=1 Tax=Sediminitomix flava TaxID=379075 RepID=A0A315ZDG2_SEDFL|nr:peroxide stress protein YaaA [Sediminitomix flava]PWJ43656.1 hypothetical protein BC781_1012 [Sediminitomix flava]
MISIISPAKTLDYETKANTSDFTIPNKLQKSEQLIKELRKLKVEDIKGLMKISDDLSALNHQRFQDWHKDFSIDNAKQAVLAFKGDVYVGLDAYNLNDKDFEFAQDHLRILSGLYGILKPLDLIQPYRLEMGSKFSFKEYKHLYDFWGNSLTEEINHELESHNSKNIINLASNEYFKAIKKKELNAEIITPIFKDSKNGQYKVISFFAKKARGKMAAFIIKNQIDQAEALKDFNDEGYIFNQNLSKGNEWVFTREE